MSKHQSAARQMSLIDRRTDSFSHVHLFSLLIKGYTCSMKLKLWNKLNSPEDNAIFLLVTIIERYTVWRDHISFCAYHNRNVLSFVCIFFLFFYRFYFNGGNLLRGEHTQPKKTYDRDPYHRLSVTRSHTVLFSGKCTIKVPKSNFRRTFRGTILGDTIYSTELISVKRSPEQFDCCLLHTQMEIFESS